MEPLQEEWPAIECRNLVPEWFEFAKKIERCIPTRPWPLSSFPFHPWVANPVEVGEVIAMIPMDYSMSICTFDPCDCEPISQSITFWCSMTYRKHDQTILVEVTTFWFIALRCFVRRLNCETVHRLGIRGSTFQYSTSLEDTRVMVVDEILCHSVSFTVESGRRYSIVGLFWHYLNWYCTPYC